MNHSQLPLAVRATAGALAVFMTMAMLNGVISIAEPQQSQLMARSTSHHVAQLAAAPQDAVLVALGTTSTPER